MSPARSSGPFLSSFVIVLALVGAACTGGVSGSPASEGTEVDGGATGAVDPEAGVVTPDGPVAPAPSTPVLPSPLTDQSRELEDILEHGELSGADCDRYFAGQDDRETSLR